MVTRTWELGMGSGVTDNGYGFCEVIKIFQNQCDGCTTL